MILIRKWTILFLHQKQQFCCRRVDLFTFSLYLHSYYKNKMQLKHIHILYKCHNFLYLSFSLMDAFYFFPLLNNNDTDLQFQVESKKKSVLNLKTKLLTKKSIKYHLESLLFGEEYF